MTGLDKKKGDFTGLAKNYSNFRPTYSESVLDALVGYAKKSTNEIAFVDVGAGAGIWTQMVCDRNVKSSVTIEPNNDMRKFGEADSTKFSIKWISGSGENIGLDHNSAGLVTMASSFHWNDFDKSTAECN